MPVLLYCYIQKPSNKGRGERKRRKKKKGGEVSKAIAGLDVLDQHTHSKLQEMEQERHNIVLQVYIALKVVKHIEMSKAGPKKSICHFQKLEMTLK